ncbi:uncharacterized protein LOC131665094 [Phymastichus coffea]|uniref:uncharacterized protein LOC131665094 n=1 Tax=Phymastichus coffea TaxID=108790 RepID=UPI00273AB512|nr:uncharacterized protein LOC131665094 [Phymastichus coffea]
MRLACCVLPLLPLLPPLLLLPSLLLPSSALAANDTATCGRAKRSLAFPKGSSFVLTVTLLKAVQVRVPSNWNLDMEFDVSWPIPAGTSALTAGERRRPSRGRQPHRRQRRQLYANLELALDSQGLPGSQCVLRAICEARFMLNPAGLSLVEDLLRVVFSYPSASASRRSVRDAYDNASVTRTDCDLAYPCPFSLLDMLLNYQNDVSTGK